MPKIKDREIKKSLTGVLIPQDISIVLSMVRTTCQSATAKAINKSRGLHGRESLTQIKVRHKYDKAIIAVQEEIQKGRRDKALEESLRLMELVRANLYILHEVKLPHFDKGKTAEL